MGEASYEPTERRPIQSREMKLFQRIASTMVRVGLSANVISVFSVIFGIGAGIAFALTGFAEGSGLRLAWIAGAALIQLRLLANMFDGMVALESGKASPVGELYNEVPDRISDAAIFIGAGYALGSSVELGYLVAVLAVFVAYVRAMGGSAGAKQAFAGPLAKPQRMFLLTLMSLYLAFTPDSWQPVHGNTGWGLMGWMLLVICAGCVVTAVRRLMIIAADLKGLRS